MRQRAIMVALGTAAVVLLTEACRFMDSNPHAPRDCVEPPRGSVSPAETTIATGEFTPRYTLLDCKDRAIQDDVHWWTEQTNVVQVERDGRIRPIGLGDAIVVLTGAEYGRLGELRVTVAGLLPPRDK